MHPAINRALRETVVTANLLGHRWPRLAERIPEAAEPFRAGADLGEELVEALAALGKARGVAVGSAASGLGATLGESMARVGEPFLERHQALRSAVLDAHHLSLLLHYLERLARSEDDAELAGAAQRWAHRVIEVEGRVRDLAIAEGDRPDHAVEPVDDSPVGQAAHKVAVGAGALGEWVDRRFA